ncbi:SLC13 family permease [Notoacmeibacter sp. MSK16QG-6]|uniref:SLC13 family permease n=1 Tax=Notoacmeibacter sp. MSK16QG-6 TaxID=2957982 RepID=UPI0020A167A0|nr:SLC13 family permease [Notoacmeibacter sp. MSK16QG-6]MCP1198466.1 SLC13 family permease [Notoacmeibacter sp. MSK16QG-6]
MGDFHIWATIFIIALTIAAYTSNRFSLEAVSIFSLAALLALFTLFPLDRADASLPPEQLLTGFANPALISVLALIIIGQGLFATDAMDRPARMIGKLGGRSGALSLIITLVAAAVLSAFLNNTPVVVIFIPVLTVLAAQRNLDVAGALLPLSYLSILGGMTTLIGSSTNLLVAGIAAKQGLSIDMFDITIPGLVLLAVGGAYVLLFVPRMIGRKDTTEFRERPGAGAQFIGEIRVGPDHPFVGMESRAGLFPELRNLMPRIIERRGVRILPPFEDVVISQGDLMVLAGTRKAFMKALAGGTRGSLTNGGENEGETAERSGGPGPDYQVVEAIVAPGSRHSGRTVRNSGIQTEHNVDVLAVQRRSRMGRVSMGDIRLEPGDNVLIGGRTERLVAIRDNHDLLVMEWSAEAVPQTQKAWLALCIFAGVVLAALSGLAPISVSASIGAVLMVATNCLTLTQAKRAFNEQIFLLVGASIAAATALEQTGGAQFLAEAVIAGMAGWAKPFILSGFFLFVAVLTNFLSNNATAVLATPVALSAAQLSGIPLEAMVATVIFASNVSFATPMGYQTNLLVMGPGGYSFGDFLRTGIPLVILVWIAFSLFAPWYYGLWN